MNVLSIESDKIDNEWLKKYFDKHGCRLNVKSIKSFADAEKVLNDGEFKPDIVLIDGQTDDALAPYAVLGIVFNAPGVPIVNLITGKTLHYECARVKFTNVYNLKTDVTERTFLKHLENIIEENKRERQVEAPQGLQPLEALELLEELEGTQQSATQPQDKPVQDKEEEVT